MINLDLTSKTPLYQQIYEQLRNEILDGSYAQGSKLTPIRTLASDLGISRNTVEAAYLQLSQEGYVSARAGSGYHVEDLEFNSLHTQDLVRENSESFLKRLEQTSIWPQPTGAPQTTGGPQPTGHPAAGPHQAGEPGESARKAEPVVRYDFTYGNLRQGSFPTQRWRRLTSDVLLGIESQKAVTYTDPLGETGLREQIAHYLHVHAGVNCHPAQVVVQPGTQASIYSLLQLFDPLRDTVAMEDPGYDGVRLVFENARFGLHPIPVLSDDGDYTDPYYLSRAKLAYVTPSNQFPTGKILLLAQRQALLRWATNTNAYIIEDDYCREYRYNMRPLPSLQSLDRDNRVIYLGTFSKALSPALRISYLVLPPDILFEWRSRFANHYPEVPWLSQAVLEAYLAGGYWEKHLNKAQATNKRRYGLLISSIKEYLGNRVDVMENGSGLHLLLGVRDGRSQNELIARALKEQVKVYGTARYSMHERHLLESYVLVGFSAIPEQDIAPGIAALARAWFG